MYVSITYMESAVVIKRFHYQYQGWQVSQNFDWFEINTASSEGQVWNFYSPCTP